MATDNDSDGLLAGLGIVGVMLIGGLAWLFTRGSTSAAGAQSTRAARLAEIQEAVESAAQSMPSSPSDPTTASDVAASIRERADSVTDPATGTFDEDFGGGGEFGSDGSVNPTTVPSDSPLSAYELEVADTDTGE